VNLQSIIKEAASVANILDVLVFGVGYFLMIKLYREWVLQSREVHAAGGRPQVVVAVDHTHLPETYLSVRNFSQAPAKDIEFGFSAPVETPDGRVLSELALFEKGLPFLEPQASLSLYWGSLPSLAPLLKKKGLEDGIAVTTKYKDLAGESFRTRWTLNPLLFEDAPIGRSRGMNDLVSAVEKLSGDDHGYKAKRAANGGEG
jgi:hypothetical protein